MQPEIRWYMRTDLIDFLVEVHADSGLLSKTLFLTINLLDRYSSKVTIPKRYYQLVGCTALLIAAKYVEGCARACQISKLYTMFCRLYSSKELIKIEQHVLKTLEWVFGNPTVDCYTQLRAAKKRDAEVEHMSAYLCEIALYHRDFFSARPSMMARVSVVLARVILCRGEVHDTTGTDPDTVALRALFQLVAEPSPTLFCKYATPNLSCVSKRLRQYMTERAAVAQRAANPSWRPNELTAKPPIIDSTPQKGCSAVAGFEDRLTPPSTPDGAHVSSIQAQKQVYVFPPPYPVAITDLSTVPATQPGSRQTWSLRTNYQHNINCTMIYPGPRILSSGEVMQMPELLSFVDGCAKDCGYNMQTNVWSCPGSVDLYPVCWFQDGCENADWLPMERFNEVLQEYLRDAGIH